jgi:hypothetical protein
MRLFQLTEPLGSLPDWIASNYGYRQAFEALQPGVLYFAARGLVSVLGGYLQASGRSSVLRILREKAGQTMIREAGCIVPPIATASTVADFARMLQNASRSGLHRPLRVAVHGFWANAIGDSIQYQPLLRSIRRMFESSGIEVHFVLFSFFGSREIEDYHRSHRDLYDEVRRVPVRAEELLSFDVLFDGARDFPPVDSPWQDCMLNLLGVPPQFVPLADRFPFLRVDGSVQREVSASFERLAPAGERRRLLLHTKASTPLRTMPRATYNRIVELVRKRTEFSMFSVDGMPAPFEVADLSDVSRASLWHYFASVSQADAFVSVDTSAIHVAAAFQTPGVGIFTGTPARSYLPNYPWMRGIDLDPEAKLQRQVVSDDPQVLKVAATLWTELNWTLFERHLDELQACAAANRLAA